MNALKTKKSLSLATDMMIHSKLRSWLTIIGIIIGIAAVVSIITLSESAQQTLQSQLSGLGADIITVTPGVSRAQGFGSFRSFAGETDNTATSRVTKNLTTKDTNILKSISNIEYVMGTVSTRGDVTYSGKTAHVSIEGIEEGVWKYITDAKLASGRYLAQGDTNVVVVGGRVANSVFRGNIVINRQITIESRVFRIVGILAEGSSSSDSSIFMPIQTIRDTFDDIGNLEFGSIIVKISNVDLTNETITAMNEKLMLSHSIFQDSQKDFTIMNPTAMQERVSGMMGSMTLLLTAIAVISLIVGAVGIANTMFTSVIEKTKEIGILKAIGTKDRDIMKIFLFNAGLIGLVGGIGGSIIGVLSSGIIGSMGGIQLGRESLGGLYINFGLIAVVLLLSIGIGMVSGAVPAYRASKLKPVDALRYE